MENLEVQEVPFEVNLNRVGLEEDFFGYIAINDKFFDFNFSAPYSVSQLQTIDFRKTKDFFNSVDLIIFNEEGEEVDLELKEFLVFYTVVTASTRITYQEFDFFYSFFRIISLFLPKETIKLLNQPKFNCGIIC